MNERVSGLSSHLAAVPYATHCTITFIMSMISSCPTGEIDGISMLSSQRFNHLFVKLFVMFVDFYFPFSLSTFTIFLWDVRPV